jgi:hypothetical protein
MSTTTNISTRTWGNYLLQTRRCIGTAARNNRGMYAGVKIHDVRIEEIIGVIDEEAERKLSPHTFGNVFLNNGRKPLTFYAYPMCLCTDGQFAAQEIVGATEDQVTCTKCRPSLKRRS